MSDFDVLVVGAGVAGAATALELVSAGWRVGLLGGSDSPSAIESLSPAATWSLDRLSVQIGLPLEEVIAWWGSDRETRMAAPGARIVARRALAENLRTLAITNGAKPIDDGNILSLEPIGDRWRLECEIPCAHPSTLTARYLIDATGRASCVGRRLGARRFITDQLCCLTAEIREPNLVGTWTESTCDGWWNLSSLSEEGTLSFYSTVAHIRQAKRDIAGHFRSTHHLRRVLQTPTFGEVGIRPAGSSRLVPCAGPRWISVGDAAATFQPLASAGVSKALRDARMVPLALPDKSADYDRLQTAEFESYLRQLAKHYELERRWLQHSFWQSN